MVNKKDIKVLSNEFKSCRKVLLALGDETRQYVILQMMENGECNGIRVGEIAKSTNLSRPAVSHHIQILKDAGIIKCRREGTKNYYYFDADTQAMEQLITMICHAKDIMASLPERSKDL